jgi:hypothetical protein
MALGSYNNGYVALLGQNQGGYACDGGGQATNIINISLKDFAGAFRPKTYEKPDPEPTPEPEPEPVPEPEPTPVPVPAEEPQSEKSGIRWTRVLLVILAVLVLLLVAYMAVGRLCPEWIDQFLYTPEELDIINR